ncbi:MAG TPA: M48 family metallopeptidase [Candidatus Saccharimonadales bacterium]|nr:M48 family metallopeptidase [Candidatus Saccharimonadales bacterium]
MLQIVYKQTRSFTRMSISINTENTILVRYPKWVPKYVAENFVKQKEEWIDKVIKENLKKPKMLPHKSKDDYKASKHTAKEFVLERLATFNEFYNFKINKVTIKNVTSRWGSCSKAGNLNFNYQIIYLKPEQADYIIVHELCHLKELNHKQAFWELVAKTIPHYKELRKQLRNIR